MKAPVLRRVQRYAAVIVRWLVVGTLTFFATMATGYYITNDVLAKVYTASAVVQLPPGDLATAASLSLISMAPQPQFETTMMSPELLLSVVKDLGLEKTWAQRLHNMDQEDLPDVDALTRIGRLVKINVRRGTNLVEITAASDLPQEAADIANAIAVHYQNLRDERSGLTSAANIDLVHVVERAVVPSEPSLPRKGVDFIVTFVSACVLSLLAASFVEMVMLFVRAGEREEN